MCIVTGPNIDIAIKLIKLMKSIFENKLGLIFQNKETVLELNRCTTEAFASNHLDAFRLALKGIKMGERSIFKVLAVLHDLSYPRVSVGLPAYPISRWAP